MRPPWLTSLLNEVSDSNPNNNDPINCLPNFTENQLIIACKLGQLILISDETIESSEIRRLIDSQYFRQASTIKKLELISGPVDFEFQNELDKRQNSQNLFPHSINVNLSDQSKSSISTPQIPQQIESLSLDDSGHGITSFNSAAPSYLDHLKPIDTEKAYHTLPKRKNINASIHSSNLSNKYSVQGDAEKLIQSASNSTTSGGLARIEGHEADSKIESIMSNDPDPENELNDSYLNDYNQKMQVDTDDTSISSIKLNSDFIRKRSTTCSSRNESIASFDTVMSELLETSHEVNNWSKGDWPTMSSGENLNFSDSYGQKSTTKELTSSSTEALSVDPNLVLNNSSDEAIRSRNLTPFEQSRQDKNEKFYSNLIDEIITLLDTDIENNNFKNRNQRKLERLEKHFEDEAFFEKEFQAETKKAMQHLVYKCDKLSHVSGKWKSLKNFSNKLSESQVLSRTSSDLSFKSARSRQVSGLTNSNFGSQQLYYDAVSVVPEETENEMTCVPDEEEEEDAIIDSDSDTASTADTIVYDDTNDHTPAPSDYPLIKYSILLVHNVIENSKYALTEAITFETSSNDKSCSQIRYRSAIDKIIVKIRKLPDFVNKYIKFSIACRNFTGFNKTIILDKNKNSQKIFFKIPSIKQMKRKKFNNLSFRIISVTDEDGHSLACPEDFKPNLIDDYPYFGMKLKEIKLDLSELKRNYLEFPIRNCFGNNFRSNIGVFETDHDNFNAISSNYSEGCDSDISAVESWIRETSVYSSDDDDNFGNSNNDYDDDQSSDDVNGEKKSISSRPNSAASAGKNTHPYRKKSIPSYYSKSKLVKPKTRQLKITKQDLLNFNDNELKLFPGGHSMKLKIKNSSKIYLENENYYLSEENDIHLKIKKIGFGKTSFKLIFKNKDIMAPYIENFREIHDQEFEFKNSNFSSYNDEVMIPVKFNYNQLYRYYNQLLLLESSDSSDDDNCFKINLEIRKCSKDLFTVADSMNIIKLNGARVFEVQLDNFEGVDLRESVLI